MIEFHFEIDFELDESKYSDWLTRICQSEKSTVGDLNYIFCTDEYLLDINQKYLSHDTFTDIITFDYCEGDSVSGDVFISVDRVKDNAVDFKVSFDQELNRVMAHGVLHLLGFKDKSAEDAVLMRRKENEKMEMFHVEH
ncbi:rRNA maturation RNase YbeY [Euzebyella marina]|uniref:Endoribonuclease YbeY n=1 Tax=Euzebyella marina TaxID=1761453 RepID=A0A3G2L1H9_9FLAO|nr:rRNA maturation RNase YbeY [Euzebyella marina]AYN66066.1 rRNA maturation RNase YbeY [Euzebyella marina]